MRRRSNTDIIHRTILVILAWFGFLSIHAQDYTQYVDPRIGSEGLGRVFIGPATPFGMVRPGPDCTCKPNSGWLPMPEVVTGFAQTHVSGTGGGPKYGNILIQPFIGSLEGRVHEQLRKGEDMSLGYYQTTFENGIQTEITTAARCSFYRITYPKATASPNLLIDAGFFLGENKIPDAREAQQFVGSETEIMSDHEVRGFSRIRGGWNNGRAYTVYFCAVSDKPFKQTKMWKEKGKSGCLLSFEPSSDDHTTIHWKIGISFISSLKAKENIPACSFDQQLEQTKREWNTWLSKIQLGKNATEQQKRMFYTAIYHTLLMPSDRTGENPLWTDEGVPYYDDYYAIWDTYRTSFPLITLLSETKVRDLNNALLNIYKRDGYLPDARSGNANGRTQGGSNAEVVLADAFVKGIKGIDYEEALRAMLKDALVPPGGNEEQEGRGGLHEYNTLGYVPYGIDRAGNRTVEYAYDDFCIAELAKGLGYEDYYERFLRQSSNWKNLWRKDYAWDGMKGFIMPKDRDGKWIDMVPHGQSKVFHPTFHYTPITREAPWYIAWWSTFFYEATSEEYSLSIPHDIPGLIEACGGKDIFRHRLDTFFIKKYYNVANEPSFLSPCLYHWIGQPTESSKRIHQIINDCYNDSPNGLPGNDDSGAMSSWLVFHMMGLYPNAGQPYYLLNTPLVDAYTLQLDNGKTLKVTVKNLSKKKSYVQQVILNGKSLERAWLSHKELMQGGELVFVMDSKPSSWGTTQLPPTQEEILNNLENSYLSEKETVWPTAVLGSDHYAVSYTLHRQYRTWPLTFSWQGDTLFTKMKETRYRIPKKVVEESEMFCWQMPLDGKTYVADGTFCFLSRKALRQIQSTGSCVYDGITWRKKGEKGNLIHLQADIDKTEMWVQTDTPLPMIVEMRNNPLNIDWVIRNK